MCNRGMNCRFAHEEPDSSIPQPHPYTNFPAQTGGNNYGRSRGICYDWQKGICQRGDSCRFTHDANAPSHTSYGQGGGGGGGFNGGYGNVRPGDWTCPACQINNFASRIQCFKCSTPKPVNNAMPIGGIGQPGQQQQGQQQQQQGVMDGGAGGGQQGVPVQGNMNVQQTGGAGQQQQGQQQNGQVPNPPGQGNMQMGGVPGMNMQTGEMGY